ncbi:hypothetical protein CALCODRAFT_487146 [Calocera cornea HHB12733]|uniref:Uncharacterized protein n=1 Tax=Calocera cornea HHB12733 TaxID=1353952 RepID=A0A165DAF2_9BASI|nr:hypothetical protein CALCODRAFT_487146 [Calocera cornea HHB12733]
MPEEAAKPPASPRKSNALEGWEKLHAKMKETDLDRERLDSVKSWLDETSANEDLLRQHWSETLNMFVFPSSRDLLRSMVKSMGWEVLPQGEDEFFWKDRSRARR